MQFDVTLVKISDRNKTDERAQYTFMEKKQTFKTLREGKNVTLDLGGFINFHN